MAAFCSREWWSDARQYQIVALATCSFITSCGLTSVHSLNSLLAIAGPLATQALCTYLFALPESIPARP